MYTCHRKITDGTTVNKNTDIEIANLPMANFKQIWHRQNNVINKYKENSNKRVNFW